MWKRDAMTMSRELPLDTSLSRLNISDCNLLLLLFLAVIGVAPVALMGDDFGGSGDLGDSIRQICFLSLFVSIVVVTASKFGIASLVQLPAGLLLLYAWIWLSLTWSIEPGIALRRIAFSSIVTLSVWYSVRCIPPERLIMLFAAFLVVVVVLDWISIYLLPFSVHSPWSDEPELAGNWRGLHSHKNEAGAFDGICVIVFLVMSLVPRASLVWSAMTVVSGLFLYMTASKTSLGFLPLALLSGWASRRLVQNGRSVIIVLSFSACILSTVLVIFWDNVASEVSSVLMDPTSLTGRVQIWPILLEFASDHLLLGAGYGSFWAIGPSSPIYHYTAGWVLTIYHAHDGYLNIMIQIGLPGVILATYILLLRPIILSIRCRLFSDLKNYFFVSIVIFVMLNNLLESSFLDRANPLWVITLMIYCMIHQYVDPVKISPTREAAI